MNINLLDSLRSQDITNLNFSILSIFQELHTKKTANTLIWPDILEKMFVFPNIVMSYIKTFSKGNVANEFTVKHKVKCKILSRQM